MIATDSASLESFLSLSGTSSAAVASTEPRLAPPLKAVEAATAGADAVGPTDLRTARIVGVIRESTSYYEEVAKYYT